MTGGILYIVLGAFLVLGGFFGLGVSFVRWYDDWQATQAQRQRELSGAAELRKSAAVWSGGRQPLDGTTCSPCRIGSTPLGLPVPDDGSLKIVWRCNVIRAIREADGWGDVWFRVIANGDVLILTEEQARDLRDQLTRGLDEPKGERQESTDVR